LIPTRWRWAVGIVGGIVVLNLALAGLRAATGGSPGGPTSSSYATAPDGDAAYAELLSGLGHRVEQSHDFPHAQQLTPNETAFVLDPPVIVPSDADALRAFAARGGRVVLAASGPSLRRVVGPGHKRGIVRISSGRLQNRNLVANAHFAARIAGPPSRPAVFFEAYHGYGHGTGLAALPASWWNALIFGAAAALVFALARVRRFGPAEEEERRLAPARREYVDAVARTVERTRDREQALVPMQAELRRRIALQAGLPVDAAPEALVAAATGLGFAADEAQAVASPPRRGGEVALGRAYAHMRARGRGTWNS
jgi:hypothetical protein